MGKVTTNGGFTYLNSSWLPSNFRAGALTGFSTIQTGIVTQHKQFGRCDNVGEHVAAAGPD